MVDVSQSNSSGNDSKDSVRAIEDSKEKKVEPELYKKLLGEKKAALVREKLALEESEKLKDELETLRREKLEREGKHEEILAIREKQIKEKEENHKKEVSRYKETSIKNQIKMHAIQAGCVNADKLIKLIDSSTINALRTDEFYRASDEEIKSIIENAKSEHADIGLFKAQVKNPHDVVPGKEGTKIINKDDLKNLTSTQLMTLHRQLSEKQRSS